MGISAALSNNSIRRKIIVFALLIMILISLNSIGLYLFSKELSKNIDEIFEKNLYLKDLNENIETVDKRLFEYLSTKSSVSLYELFEYNSKLMELAEQIDRRIYAKQEKLFFKDIYFMLQKYTANVEKAVDAKRSRKSKEYSGIYNETNKILRYIKLYIEKLNFIQFHTNTSEYIKLSRRIARLQLISVLSLFIILLFTVILVFWFSIKLTDPIIRLSSMAKEISKGNFSVPDIEVKKTNDEIEILSNTVNEMKHNITDHINELKEKADVESKLAEEEMKNLKMKNMVKSAELKALQAQMNPHFLFNTLNAGVQLAMFEDAEKTGIFLEKMSLLLRYSLKNIGNPVTLGDELENVSTYIYLLKIRFGSRFDFEIISENEELSKLKMPLFTLQPLVENAFLHGVRNLDRKGKIEVVVKNDSKNIIISVVDDGVGIEQEKIEKIMKHELVQEEELNSKGNGIGVGNVIERFKHYYSNGKIEILSTVGKGTEIRMFIPMERLGK